MRTVYTALSRVPGVQQVEFQGADQFLVTYDASIANMIETCKKTIEALGYGVKI